jgi:hypothetical protein
MARVVRRGLGRRGTSLIDVVTGTMILAGGVLSFVALYPTAAQSSRLSTDYSEAMAEVQHKVDQLRSVGYGRLNYSELLAAGIIDASPNAAPFRFDTVDNIGADLKTPTGTITFTTISTGLTQATITLQWKSGITRTSTHEVKALIARE